MKKTVKFLTKEMLVTATNMAIARGYNRQLNIHAVKRLPDESLFPVQFSMIHEHIAGKAVTPHVRAWIVFSDKGESGFLDMDTDLFNLLPTEEIEVP